MADDRKMFQCPVCSEPTISLWAKWNAYTWYPATCSNCGAKIVTGGFVNQVFGMILFFCGGILPWVAIFSKSWVPIIALLFIYIAFEAVALKFFPLQEHRKREKRPRAPRG